MAAFSRAVKWPPSTKTTPCRLGCIQYKFPDQAMGTNALNAHLCTKLMYSSTVASQYHCTMIVLIAEKDTKNRDCRLRCAQHLFTRLLRSSRLLLQSCDFANYANINAYRISEYQVQGGIQVLTTLPVSVPVLSRHTTWTSARFLIFSGRSTSMRLLPSWRMQRPNANVVTVGTPAHHWKVEAWGC